MQRLKRILLAMVLTCASPALAPGQDATSTPAGVSQRMVTIAGPIPLPGIFTYPTGGEALPVVVIVHGSGPGDRNGTVGPNAPYRDIAFGLAQRGVATLRYDKRTRVAPFWFASRQFTVHDEVIEDALLAAALARTQPEADSRRVVVAGHSLGGLLAPRIASADTALAGMIILAGATDMSLPDQLDRQFAYALTVPGADTVQVRSTMRALAPGIAKVRALTAADTTSVELLVGAPSRYWLDLAARSSSTVMKSIRTPALVVQGGRDYQVTTNQLDAWLAELGDRADVTVKRYPELNHLFIAGSGISSFAEYLRPGTVDAQLIDDIAEWVRGL